MRESRRRQPKRSASRSWMRRICQATICATLLSGCAGCWNPPEPTAHQLEQGLIWMFPGVEGGPWALRGAHDALRDAGVESAIRMHDWSRPFGTIANLVAYERNRCDAATIARSIDEYHRAHPESPIDLVGYSGGGGVAVMVAEALPEQVPLRNLILAQPAVSPDYDLTPLLRKVRGKLVNFHSPLDWIILGSGTSVFGTMDRSFGPSAGKDGFNLEAAVREEKLRERVDQRVWSGKMLARGHYGGHLGILLYSWNRHFVAPYLLSGGDADDPDKVNSPQNVAKASNADEKRPPGRSGDSP